MSQDIKTLNENVFAPEKTNNPLADPQAYYRSKLFTVTHCLNPLVAASAPLSTFTRRILNQLYTEPPEEALHSLRYEMQAFETQARRHGYPSKTIMAGRFLLCAWIDEVISQSGWGQENNWDRAQLASQVQTEVQQDVDFFQILKRTMQDPAVHIDLLELMYLFLALGYEGKYREEARGHQTLAAIMDSLYQCISYQRGDHNRRLLSHIPRPNALSKPKTPSSHRLLTIILASCLISSTVFFIFNTQLNRASQPILEALGSLPQQGPST